MPYCTRYRDVFLMKMFVMFTNHLEYALMVPDTRIVVALLCVLAVYTTVTSMLCMIVIACLSVFT